MTTKKEIVKEVFRTYLDIRAYKAKGAPLPESFNGQIGFLFMAHQQKKDDAEIVYGMLTDYLRLNPSLPSISKEEFSYCLNEIMAEGVKAIASHRKDVK